MTAVVRVDPGFERTSQSSGITDRALSLLPGLRRHTCENDQGLHFGAELSDTETAHLLEHVTVELMALAGSPRSLHAETSWDFSADGRGRYRLAIEYDDDLVALGALKDAAGIVGWLFTEATAEGSGGALSDEGVPDVKAMVARLAALRAR